MDNAAYHIRIPKTSTAFELVQIDSVLHLSIVPCHVDNVCVTFMYMLDCRVNSKSLIFFVKKIISRAQVMTLPKLFAELVLTHHTFIP